MTTNEQPQPGSKIFKNPFLGILLALWIISLFIAIIVFISSYAAGLGSAEFAWAGLWGQIGFAGFFAWSIAGSIAWQLEQLSRRE